MKTPFPRGFTRSPSETVCEHVRLADRPARRPLTDRQKAVVLAGRTEPRPLDLCALFDLRMSLCKDTREERRAIRPLAVRVTTARDERKIYLPGPPHVKKDGTVRDTLIPTLLITVQILVQSGPAAPVPVYQATNKGRTVLDLRTQARVPLCEVRRELLRLCPEDAERHTAELAALLREEKPAPRAPAPTPAVRPAWMDAVASPMKDDNSRELKAMDAGEFASHRDTATRTLDIIARAGTPDFYCQPAN